MVKVDNLVKRYGSFQLEASMEIREGTVTAIIGKNGAGKTTLIKAILGLIRPDEGYVSVFGTEADKLTSELKSGLGVTLTDSGFSQEFTVEDIIRILKKAYNRFDEDMFRTKLMEEKIDCKSKLRKLSTGMRTKIRLLTAITHEAKFLILDEPTAGLDAAARIKMLDMLRDYLEEDESRSILITSHIASDIEEISDEIYLIDEGRIILHEETGNIIDSYGVIKVREEEFDKLDQQYILAVRKASYGYTCLTDEKRYYIENYPNTVVESSGIDDIIVMMSGGI